MTEALGDSLGASVGRQRVYLKKTAETDESTAVQVRHLIGCVSVVGDDGAIYQYKVDKADTSISYMSDLNVFGYVYVAPFSTEKDTLQLIVDSRQLVRAQRNAEGDVLTKFNEIIQLVDSHQDINSFDRSSISPQAALQMAQAIREQQIFVDSTEMKNALEKSRQDIECSVDMLREDIQEKTEYYRTSIDAFHEQFVEESEKTRAMMKAENEIMYEENSKRLNEQLSTVQSRLELYIQSQTRELTKYLEQQYSEIVQVAKGESSQALEQVNQAVLFSEQLEKRTTKKLKQMETLMKSMEQQQQVYEANIQELGAKVQNDMERAKQMVEQSAAEANGAASAARQSASAAKDVEKAAKEQIGIERQKSENILAEAREVRKQSEKMVRLAHDAERQAKRAADASLSALERLEKHLK